jgi:hypothetical protein
MPYLRVLDRQERTALGRSDTHARVMVTLSTGAPDLGHRRVIIVLDRSASMEGRPLADALATASAVERLLPDGTELGLVTFDATVTVVLPPAPLDESQRLGFRAGLGGVRVGAGTHLLDAAGVALDLGSQARGPALVLLLTDGDERGPRAAMDAFAAHRRQLDRVTLSTFALGRHANRRLLSLLSSWGHGRSYVVAERESVAAPVGAEIGTFHGSRLYGVGLTVHPAPGVSVARVHPRVPRRIGNALQLVVPSLQGDVERHIVLDLELASRPVAVAGSEVVSLGLVSVVGFDGSGREHRRELPIEVPVYAEAGPFDREVAAEVVAARVGSALADAEALGAAAVWATFARIEEYSVLTGVCDQQPAAAALATAREMLGEVDVEALAAVGRAVGERYDHRASVVDDDRRSVVSLVSDHARTGAASVLSIVTEDR